MATAPGTGGTAIEATWSFSGVNSGVNSIGHARFKDLTINATTQGRFWDVGIRLTDAGGVSWDDVRIINATNTSSSRSAIELVRNKATAITSFYISNSILRGYQSAIRLSYALAAKEGTVEGLYVINTEMVSVQHFIYDDNATAKRPTHKVNGVHLGNSHGNASRVGFEFGWISNFYLTGNNFSFQNYLDATPAPLAAAVRATVAAQVWTITGNRFFRNSSVTLPAVAIVLPDTHSVSRIRVSGNSFDNWTSPIRDAAEGSKDRRIILLDATNQVGATPSLTSPPH